MLDMSARQWKQGVLEAAENKFERRLVEESAGLRLEIAAVRVDMAALHLEIARAHASMLRWTFVQWITMMLTIVGLATRI